MAQAVKRLPTMLETWLQSLGREDLEKGRQPTPVFLPPSPLPPKKALIGHTVKSFGP